MIERNRHAHPAREIARRGRERLAAIQYEQRILFERMAVDANLGRIRRGNAHAQDACIAAARERRAAADLHAADADASDVHVIDPPLGSGTLSRYVTPGAAVEGIRK